MVRGKGIKGLRAVGWRTIALMALLPSLLLQAQVSPVAGQATLVENRLMRSVTDLQGNVWAVWERDDGTDTDIYYSRQDGRGWRTPRPLSAQATAWETSPSLALAADGTLWAAWSQSTGPDQASIWLSHWQIAGWSSPTAVPGTADLRGQEPMLAPAPDGGLWLAWVGHDGTDREIFVSRQEGTTWSPPQQVGTDDTSPRAYDAHPVLVVNADDAAWLAWTSHEGALNDEIHASHWDGRAWSPQQPVSNPDGTPDARPSLALDARGRPWIAWHGVPAGEDQSWRVFTSRWDNAQSAWDPETLVSSPESLPLDGQHPILALDSKGQLQLAWVISGEQSGIAHTIWDGAKWVSPSWRQTDQPVEAPLSMAGGEPLVLWGTPEDAREAPVQQAPLDEMTEPLPSSLPPARETSDRMAVLGVPIPNRYLAHGDSITWGLYPNVTGETSIPYTTVLEAMLDDQVTPSEVINWGKPGERARSAKAEERIEEGVRTYFPETVFILEGTNDISNNDTPSEVAFGISMLIKVVRQKTNVPGVRIMISTLTPRLDAKGDLIPEVNSEFAALSQQKGVPLADPWQAFYNYGPWPDFYIDHLHPGTVGLRIIAETFFQKLGAVGWITMETTPPTAWINTLPSPSQCPAVPVTWEGDDGPGSGVASFDVQVQDNGGAWTNWLLETSNQGATYGNARYGHTLGFRVRARDMIGNLGAFSPAAQSFVDDPLPPASVSVASLPPAQKVPFTVSWSGTDTCDPQLTYDVKYCVGDACSPTTGVWNTWLTSTTSTSTVFSPSVPQYGQRYSFRARAYDDSGKWKDSTPVSTRLARFTLDGEVLTVRDEPVALATVTAAGALAVDRLVGSGFRAYVGGAGTYDLSASRSGFGSLPPMYAVEVTGADLEGLDFVLPPLADIVQDGGFESGNLNAWLVSGSVGLADGHTGHGAVRLGGDGGSSSLSQSLSVPASLSNATLSFMVKLDGTSGGNSLEIGLEGTPFSQTVPVSPGGWTHVWYDVSSAGGQQVTLVFTVSGSPAVLLDEVSLGSAISGGSWNFMPLIAREATP